MSEKDISEKMLISCNDVFADIINFYFFNGEDVVKEDELEQATDFSGYKEDGDLHEMRRDELKNWRKQKLRISAFGIENQSKAEKDLQKVTDNFIKEIDKIAADKEKEIMEV